MRGSEVPSSERPFFTIVTVCYNAVHDLPATIASVAAQTTDDFEYLIVDGGSRDGTVDLLREQGDRIRFVSEPDRGIYDACNKGMGLARGRFVNILMAGDTHEPGFLATNRALLEDGSADFTYGGVVAERPKGGTVVNVPGSVEGLRDIAGMPFAHPTLVVRTEIAQQLRYDERYRYAADLDFICRLYGEGYRGRNTGQALSRYSMGGVGNSYRSIRESWEILRRTRGLNAAVMQTTAKQYVYTFLIRNGLI